MASQRSYKPRVRACLEVVARDAAAQSAKKIGGDRADFAGNVGHYHCVVAILAINRDDVAKRHVRARR